MMGFADRQLQSPSAFESYQHYCTHSNVPTMSLVEHQRALVGKCLLIAPYYHEVSTHDELLGVFPRMLKDNRTYSKPTTIEKEKRFWIACLFTSNDYGKNVDPPESVLKATATALNDLDLQLRFRREESMKDIEKVDYAKMQTKNKTGSNLLSDKNLRFCERMVEVSAIGRCYAVRLNSGLFGVPWERTKDILRKGKVNMVVVSPPDEGGGTQGQTSNGKKKDSTDELKKEIQSIKAEMKMMKDHISTMKEGMDRLRNGQDHRAPRPAHGTKRKIDVIDVDDDEPKTKKEEPDVKLERNGS
ncbi:MAG: hypothetical protein LQ350_003429 [Teloschistes chrysophthalmus]|nr:MAG: hypothetical protein LQ350_003429 [Niorma chrysophthalma]